MENQNTGHGHVFPRPDKVVARCGGPALCDQCRADLARKNATPDGPAIAVPADWQGTDAEAVGLAVAGAVASIARERDLAIQHLGALVSAFPETSFSAEHHALEKAKEFLADLTPPDQEPTP